LKVQLIPDAPLSLTCRPYPLSRPEQIFQDQYIKENLARGFIRESTLPYATPVFYNKKKDGTYQPLFDYRKLNAITVKDVSPLPRIDTIIEDIAGMIKFSAFDLWEGYYNLHVNEQSEDLLAFKTTIGLYAPTVMPFGPTNCPAAMQRFMNHIFAPLYAKYNHWFKNYMDDCLIATSPGEDNLHQEITVAFFTILRENNLFLKLAKCIFAVPEVNFLGLRLIQKGVTLDLRKVSAIRDWPQTPRNLKELRSLLGVLGYQCPFIPNFTKIAHPVTALLKANAEFIWMDECRKAIDLLVDVVTSSPVLVAPDQD
jgi:hypothetical protein